MKTKNILFFLFAILYLAFSLSAKEVEVVFEDWKNGTKGWSTALAEKESPPGTICGLESIPIKVKVRVHEIKMIKVDDDEE